MDRDLGKFTVGQTVWVKVEEGSNYASRLKGERDIEKWIFEGEVTKVGRKYITVKFGYHEEKFEIENDYRQFYTCGGADFKLYLSKQEILDEIESDKLYRKIKSDFSNWKNNNKFSLDQLKRIKDIIEEE